MGRVERKTKRNEVEQQARQEQLISLKSCSHPKHLAYRKMKIVKLLGISVMWSLVVLAGSGCASRQLAVETPKCVCARIISGISTKSPDQLHDIGRGDIVYYYQSSPGEGSRHRVPEKQLSVSKFASSIRWSLNVPDAIETVIFDADSGIASAYWIGQDDPGLVATLRVKFYKNGPWLPMEVHLCEQCIKTK